MNEWLGSSWDNDWTITCSINPSEKNSVLKSVLAPLPHPSNCHSSEQIPGRRVMPPRFFPPGAGEAVWRGFLPLLLQIPYFKRMTKAPSRLSHSHQQTKTSALWRPHQSYLAHGPRALRYFRAKSWKVWGEGAEQANGISTVVLLILCALLEHPVSTAPASSALLGNTGVKGLHPNDTLQRAIPWTKEDRSPTHLG